VEAHDDPAGASPSGQRGSLASGIRGCRRIARRGGKPNGGRASFRSSWRHGALDKDELRRLLERGDLFRRGMQLTKIGASGGQLRRPDRPDNRVDRGR
jgi:hypothetical protein